MRQALIVKLGGSLAGSVELRQWLDYLSNLGENIVVIPGGGPFADTVRAQQPIMGFDNVSAHHMALLAMQQFGVALCSLAKNFILTQDLRAMQDAWRNNQIAVWSVVPAALLAKQLPQSWDVTSDSLALWLAQKMKAKLVLVKRFDVTEDTVIIEELSAEGKLDCAFLGLFNNAPVPAYITSASALANAQAKLHTNPLFAVKLRQK